MSISLFYCSPSTPAQRPEPFAAPDAGGERDAEAEQADAAQAQGAVVPGGLSDREASALQAQRKANAAFRELRAFNKGDVLVLMGPQGNLEIAQAKSNTNLDTQDAFEVRFTNPTTQAHCTHGHFTAAHHTESPLHITTAGFHKKRPIIGSTSRRLLHQRNNAG